MKRITKILSACAAFVLCAMLCACTSTSTSSSYLQYSLDEVSGVKVEAENGTADQEALTEAGLVVTENDRVCISPVCDKGSFHITITPTGSTEPVYDEDAEGSVLYYIDLKPGTYDVTTYGNGVTGELVIAAQNSDDIAAMDASLDEALADAGVDPETVKSDDKN